ncbi:MAG: hypothetical protein NT029_05495 [Armatimonadetes bacterium]|nr:hypothetical protein [Armatimonadota bacterium]
MPGPTEERLHAAIRLLPAIDAHTHLVGGRLSAAGLHDILLYHMAVSDLYAAGCPSGARLTQYPGRPDDAEASDRLAEAVPYLPLVANTGISWGVRIILGELYGWTQPVTPDNWREVDDLVRRRSADPAWPAEVQRRAGIVRFGTEYARREGFADRDRLFYSLEWAFFTRCQWGEYDTAIYELERCWGRSPDSPAPIGGGGRPATERTVRAVGDVLAAVDHYVSAMPLDCIVSMATHISTDLDLRPVRDEEMAAALQRRPQAGPAERDVYASYVNEAFLAALERLPRPPVFQFSFGAEPLPCETASRLSQRSIAQLAEMVSRWPGLRFQCFLASRHANQSLCTLCRELPNLSLAGYWWHNFFPSAIGQIMEERLEMLPINKQIGFFSDAYCIEWAYAKSRMVRRLMAGALARKVEQGIYTEADALRFAAAMLLETPRALLGLDETGAPVGLRGPA